MKYFLDTCALRYVLGYYEEKYVEKEFKFNLYKLKNDLKKSELITDGFVVFELLNDIRDIKKFFNDVRKYNSSIYIKFYKYQYELHQRFKMARDNEEYQKFFNKLTDVALRDYTIQLSKIIFTIVSYLIGIEELKNGFRRNKNENKEYSKKVSEILLPARLHIEKILRSKLRILVNNNMFNEKNAQKEFDFVFNKLGYYFDMLPIDKILKNDFYKLLNRIKDYINEDDFSKSFNGNYTNLPILQNYIDTQNINKNDIINLYCFNDGEVLKPFLNITLNRMFIRKNTNFRLNDIKDAIIAENYLSNAMENVDEDIIFVTFDLRFIKKLRNLTIEPIQNSLRYIDSLYI
ncbi:MAG: hypothetical protein ACI4R8_02960 [Candidatus Caccovivens sp.]